MSPPDATAQPAGSITAGVDRALLDAQVAEHLGLTLPELQPDALLAEDLGIDSLAAVELVMALEDLYDIRLPDEALADVHTYGDLVAALGSRLAVRPTR